MQAQKGDSKSKLAVAERDSGKIHIYDVRSGSDEPLASFEVHRAPVVAMRYNAAHDSVISVDQKGIPKHTRHHLTHWNTQHPCNIQCASMTHTQAELELQVNIPCRLG